MRLDTDILIVDDEITNLRLLVELLEKEGYQVRPAEKAQMAIDSVQAKQPDLILLDVRMPEMDGFELCRRLKQDERTQNIPVIFLGSLNDIDVRMQGFEVGGVDFISKPIEEQEVLARVRTHTQLHQMQQHLEKLVNERANELKESKIQLEQKVRALRKSEERYQLAVAGSAAGLWDWDIHLDKVHYSDRIMELLGYTPDEFSDSPDEFWNRLHPDDYESARVALDKHLKDRVTFDIDYRIRTKSGKYRWFHGRGQALWDNKGIATRMSGSLTDITERKLADEALRQSKEFNQSILNSLQDHIAVLDSHGTILAVNDAWARFAMENDINFPESVGPGVNYLRICRKVSNNGDETGAKALDGIQSVIDGSSECFEMEYTCDSPTAERWFLMRVIPFTGRRGKVIVAHINITSRKMAEEENRISKERYELVVSGSDAGIWDYNISTGEIYYSDRFKELLGYEPHEMNDHTPEMAWDFLHPDFREIAPLKLNQHLEKQTPYYHIDYLVQKKSGEYRWFQARGKAVWDENGNPTRVSGSFIDIHEQKIADEKLKRSEERFRHLMEHSPIAIAILTPDGKLSQVNAAWKKLWGLRDEETAQVMASYNFLTDKQVENLGHAPLVERAFKGEHIIMPPIKYEGNRTIEDIGLEDIEAQSRMVQVHIYPVKNDKGEIDYVVAINMDLTELKQAEQEALVQRESLARIDRASSMGQLTASIAHELNQPLTGILSNAQAAEILLEKGQYDHDELTEIMAEIGNDAKRSGEVIRSLREMYREQKGEFLPVHINAIIDETIKLLHNDLVLQNVKLTTEYVPSMPMVNGNRIQIQQVLVNLIMNAEQAMSSMKQENRKILIVTEYDENQVKVCVDDFGQGIKVDKIDRIFEPLATWKPGGIGMGLAISNSIITAHGGRMWAENRSEGGARVGFAIPVLKGGNQS